MTDQLQKEIPWYFADNPSRVGYEEWYLAHYREVSTERRVEGYYVPRSEIVKYGEGIPLSGRDLDIFVHFMRGIDEFLIDRHRSKQDKKMKQQAARQKAAQAKKPVKRGRK